MTIDMTASSLRSEAETLPCRREDAELFFAESPADLELAKTLCHTCPVPYDEELFGSLKAWRKERADAESVPAYVVFSDATLEALAEVRPTDRQALLRINGIGAAKLEKYADDVLEILA